MRASMAVLVATLALASACGNTTVFHTTPRGAKVYVNGEPCGDTPCAYHTRYGFPDRVRVQIVHPGYQPAEFFLDTEPPLASYLLFGFGSYFFHTFDEEYRFNLQPQALGAPAPQPAPPPPPAATPPTAAPPPAAAPELPAAPEPAPAPPAAP